MTPGEGQWDLEDRTLNIEDDDDATPRGNKALLRDYENHWFPLIRPAIRALFLGGGWLWGGYLRFP